MVTELCKGLLKTSLLIRLVAEATEGPGFSVRFSRSCLKPRGAKAARFTTCRHDLCATAGLFWTVHALGSSPATAQGSSSYPRRQLPRPVSLPQPAQPHLFPPAAGVCWDQQLPTRGSFLWRTRLRQATKTTPPGRRSREPCSVRQQGFTEFLSEEPSSI